MLLLPELVQVHCLVHLLLLWTQWLHLNYIIARTLSRGVEGEIVEFRASERNTFEVCSNIIVLVTLPSIVEHSLLYRYEVRTNHIRCHIRRSNTGRRVPM